ncbi:MAG: hypothetical protein H0V89_13680 [Deltaproteobacteria bacterium]|nr:hypothetical protein [Deltaproteobacteria bacterium]
MKLPREIEANPRHAAIAAVLARDARALWSDGTLAVAHVPLDAPLEAALVAASNARQLQRGLERIEQVLEGEQRGLDALHEKQGTAPANRASRLLLAADEGSERFYRLVERLLLRHGDRLLGLRVEASPARLSQAIFGRDLLVKAVLVSDRDGVTSVLRSLGPTP